MNEYDDQVNTKAAAQASCLPGNIGGLARVPLIESVRRQANDANEQRIRGNRLDELAYLLEKNPEVARILDLMEEVRR